MGRRADVVIADVPVALHTGAGTDYLVKANNGFLYLFYIDQINALYYRRSDDGGLSWSMGLRLDTTSTTAVAVWYDRWSGINGDLIHYVYQDATTDDTFYRTMNTASSDALSTRTTIFLGASTLPGGHLSVTRAVGGNVYCKTVIDAGTEGGFYRLTNGNVPNGAWDAARTVDETIATTDQMILLPNLTAADNQDIMAVFWDASADEISRKLYDDSANSWGETSIAVSMADIVAATTQFPNFSATVDLVNNQIVLIAWSAADLANADLRCWSFTDSSVVAATDVVTNSTDDQGLCGITIDPNTGYWWAFYGGASNGSETYPTAVNIYGKVSKDNGTTWGSETRFTAAASSLRMLAVCPRMTNPAFVTMSINSVSTYTTLRANVDVTQPRAQSLIGV